MKKIDGKEVGNSPRSIRLNVTEEDLRGAEPLNPENCAAARCIKRTLKVDGVKVHRNVTYVLPRGAKKWQRLKTSGPLRMETIIFDRGGQFMLGEYDLISPPPSMIVGGSLKTRKPGATGKTARLRLRRQVIPGVRASANQKTNEE